MATFDFLRLSLSVPKIGPLDNSRHSQPSDSRREYIEYLFSSRIDFFHRKSLFSFVPAISKAMPDGVLAGFIGRQISELENAGPENLFALQPHKTWKASFLTVDTDPNSQIVAVERRQDVGAAHSVIENLVDARLTERRATSWHVDVEYVTRKEGFIEAASKYKGQITELQFIFNPQNGLKGFDKFKEFDRLAKEETNSEKSEYALKNQQGAIVPEGDFVDSAVDYASEGAGQIKMKAGRRKVYDSRQSKKTVSIPESVMPREGEETKIAGAAEILKSEADKNSQSEEPDG